MEIFFNAYSYVQGKWFKSKLEKCKVITVRIYVFRSNFSVMNLLGSISVREFQTPKKSDLFQSHLNSIGYIQVFTDLVVSRVPCSNSFVLNQSHMPLYPIPLYPNIYKNIIRQLYLAKLGPLQGPYFQNRAITHSAQLAFSEKCKQKIG